MIDRDIYSLQHYLVECIARCTTHLNVVVSGANKTINSITQKWKANQWKTADRSKGNNIK